MRLNVRSKVWVYSGFAGWHFTTIGKTLAARIKKESWGPRRGFGSIRVDAKIGKTQWKTLIFPTKEGTYLLALKAEVRKKERIAAGDRPSVQLTLLLN